MQFIGFINKFKLILKILLYICGLYKEQIKQNIFGKVFEIA